MNNSTGTLNTTTNVYKNTVWDCPPGRETGCDSPRLCGAHPDRTASWDERRRGSGRLQRDGLPPSDGDRRRFAGAGAARTGLVSLSLPFHVPHGALCCQELRLRSDGNVDLFQRASIDAFPPNTPDIRLVVSDFTCCFIASLIWSLYCSQMSPDHLSVIVFGGSPAVGRVFRPFSGTALRSGFSRRPLTTGACRLVVVLVCCRQVRPDPRAIVGHARSRWPAARRCIL